MSELIQLEQRRNRNFRTIYLESVDDQRLSWKAKGLHIYLMSRPSGWKIRHKDLENRAKDGKSSLQTAVSELRECGYLKIERLQDDDGKLAGSQWIVTESPTSLPLENQPYPLFPDAAVSGEPVSGKSVSGESGSVVSSNGSKKDLKQEEKPTSPTRNDQTFPPENYRIIEKAYTRITSIEPQGAEWSPIQQACKSMFMNGRTPEQIIALMEAFEASDAEWTANWKMDTVRLKLPEYLAGHLDLSSNGDRPKRPGTARGKAYYLGEDLQRADGHDPQTYEDWMEESMQRLGQEIEREEANDEG